MRQKETAIAQAWAAWERQQKEIDRQTDLINRLSGGGQAGRAEAAKKALEKIQSEEQLLARSSLLPRPPATSPSLCSFCGAIWPRLPLSSSSPELTHRLRCESTVFPQERPWVEKRRPFRFPDPPRSGRIVLRTKGLTQE